MEALYAKLYDRYSKLKKKKLSELDEVNREQEEKFLNFVSAAEEFIDLLRSEKANVQEIVENLRSELISVRSAKDKEYAEHQKLLMEEEQKNKILSEEVEKLKELLQEAQASSSKNGTERDKDRRIPESPGALTRSMRKRSRASEDISKVSMTTPPCVSNHDKVTPTCCSNSREGSSDSTICTFRTLGEYLLGMELSATNQSNGVRITAFHSSSGYSFNLTWVNNSDEKEPELLYNVVSLGTFEEVAPEWMRDVMMFSTSMCPVFFEKVSRVIKLQS